ncbi:MAG: hypothetical protein FWG08_01825 [Propionibacteriaceae bacterium]|nr:hypothetical protein [Propionibacteriaceae bacterium]
MTNDYQNLWADHARFGRANVFSCPAMFDLVDHTRFGYANQFKSSLPIRMIGTLKVGDIVSVYDDGVDSYLCRISSVVNEGQKCYFERLEPLED